MTYSPEWGSVPWETALFDCFSDPRVCCVSLFCAPCQGAFQKSSLEDRDCAVTDLLMFIFCAPCCFIQTRIAIRDKYGFQGSIVGDICSFLLCGPCAVAQQTRQLRLKGKKPAGFCMDTEADPLLS